MEPGVHESPRKERPGGGGTFRAGDVGLLVAMVLSVLLLVLGITGRILEPEPVSTAGGARQIDAARYERLIGEGTLSGREALFFHTAEPGGKGVEKGAAREQEPPR